MLWAPLRRDCRKSKDLKKNRARARRYHGRTRAGEFLEPKKEARGIKCNPAPSTSPRGSRGRMLATEGEHGSEAGVREGRALRSEASLASCLSALPAPVLSLPRNDKLASLTGPNKGKTHITHGTAWRGRGDGWFSSGWCGQWRRMKHERKEGRGEGDSPGPDGKTAIERRRHARNHVPRRKTPRPPPRL